MLEKTNIQFIKQSLFQEPQTNVYAVLDGASVPDLPQVLWEQEPECVCLWRGDLEPDMAEVAPYLVRLAPDHPFTDWLVAEGWGNHWGIFALSPADLKAMRKHFRTFLMVKTPEGKRVYFRYYDPRVLRIYLPTCNSEETRMVFGPTLCYLLEAKDRSIALRFSPGQATPLQEEIRITRQPS